MNRAGYTKWGRDCLTIAASLGLGVIGGCSSSLEQIDHQVDALVIKTNSEMSGDNLDPKITDWNLETAEQRVQTEYDPIDEYIPTVNPRASDLEYIPTPSDDAQRVIDRLDGYNRETAEAIELDLIEALNYSIRHSRNYRFAEEEFVLTALRLLIERHLWGPRFFDDITATIDGDATEGLFDTSFSLVNEFRVTQRLPYGGSVSARALARATEELHGTIFDGGTQSADIILSADIPLLRGAGTVARETRIQSERNMIYAARTFERFRREFLFDISSQFLDLVLRQRGLTNSERSVDSFIVVEERQRARYQEGRIDLFDAALAENATVDSRDSLNSSREAYRLAVDRFKIQLGMPVEQELVIIDSNIGIPVPDVTIDDAVRIAMSYRLDLQTQRDRLADAKRSVANARNDLLPDLNVDASVTIPTDPDNSSVVDYDPQNMSFVTGVTFGLPLDREIERIGLRQAQINLERSFRNYQEFRDNVAIQVRAAVREIDASLFSLQIQQRGIDIAAQRIESIQSDPDRATPRDMTEAVDDQLRAEDDRDRARRNVEVSIMRYLLETGQLRVTNEGQIRTLDGMELIPSDPDPEDQPDPDDPSDTNDPDENGSGTSG